MANAHDYVFPKLAEADASLRLADYAGKVVLVVNVASACGYTSQYRDLEQLYEAKVAKGLVIVGVPCNDFGAQEAGAEGEIRAFCDSAYHVTFPMAGKVEIVAEARRHPFYQWIAHELGEGALPRWNFHKFLIGKDGALIDSFPSKAAPLGPEVLGAIKQALEA
ncbi:MAG: glutathione peroxidase [Hyphomonadaceae bacterium]|nr:glutathione peroxidase [Hyphomonadaceae bacterium]